MMKTPEQIQCRIRQVYDQEKGLQTGSLEDLWETCTFEVLSKCTESEVEKYDKWMMDKCCA